MKHEGRDDGAGMVPLCKVGLTGYACLMQRTVPVLGSNSRCNSELLEPWPARWGKAVVHKMGLRSRQRRSRRSDPSRFQIQIQKGVMQDRYVPAPGEHGVSAAR